MNEMDPRQCYASSARLHAIEGMKGITPQHWQMSTPCGGDYNAALWGNSWAFFVGRTMNIIPYQHWFGDRSTYVGRKKHRIIGSIHAAASQGIHA